METTRIFCRLSGYIEGTPEEIRKLIESEEGDASPRLRFIATKEGYIPADSIEGFYSENYGADKDWYANDLDFNSPDSAEYPL